MLCFALHELHSGTELIGVHGHRIGRIASHVICQNQLGLQQEIVQFGYSTLFCHRSELCRIGKEEFACSLFHKPDVTGFRIHIELKIVVFRRQTEALRCGSICLRFKRCSFLEYRIISDVLFVFIIERIFRQIMNDVCSYAKYNQ